MASRTFSPVLKRRASPPAARTSVRPASPLRSAGATAGTPRFASPAQPTTLAQPEPAAFAKKAPGISQRNDRWENEAHFISATAVRSAPATFFAASTPGAKSAPVFSSKAPPAFSRSRLVRMTPRERHLPATAPPLPVSTSPLQITSVAPLPDVASTGQPLSSTIRHRLESVLGADLSVVRVHTGPAAHHVAESVHARAFTVGNHIYLGARESSSDLAVIAHEVAHVVQQSATAHAAPPRGPPHSRAPPSLTAAPRGMIQRWEAPGWLKATGNVIAHPIDTAGKVVDAGAELVAEGFWAVVDKLAPKKISELLHDIKDHGFIGVLKTKVSAALDFVFASLKAQGGTAAKIATVFETLIAKAKPILAALAAGDCKPLFAAVKSLGDMFGKMAGEAWDKLTTFLKPVGDWLSNVWNKFGAPVVDFLKEFAADTWDWIKDLGQDLWDLTAPVRKIYSGAWTEIKNLLGFGEGSDDDGSGGVVGWIKEKAGIVWDGIKTELKPIIDPIKNAASAINDFLPIKDILNLREKINEWMDKATAMADNMDQPDDLAENKNLLHDIVLPGIKRAIVKLRAKVVDASAWATSKIGGLVSKVTGFFTTLSGNTLLSPLKGVIQWLNDEAVEVGTWATEKVAGLFATADNALVTLDAWLEPVIKTVEKFIDALGDLMGHLGDLVLGPLLLVPKCIRDPIKDFVVTKILSQIPVFAQLVELPAIWAKVAPAFRAVVVSIFRDGNLFRAAWIFFRTVLDLLGVPPELVTKLIRNAAKAIKDVLKDPVGFLGNVLEAMKLGLLQFIDNIGKHLLKGAVDWLLSGVKGPGIKIADPFVINLKNVLDLVLQVLDLTMEKVFQRIEKKKGKEVADKCRKIAKVVDKAIEWITVLINEGPSGLWKHVQKELSNLWDTMLGMVVDYLVGKIVQQATIWVTKTLASGGLSVIIDAVKAIYDALQVVAQYLKQMLEVANSVCEGISDIAKGVLTKGANMVENAAARLIPMVLSFLAKTLGIGDLPVVIGEGIQKVRKKVEDAIDTLIDKTFALIDWAKQKGKEAVDALLGWLGIKEKVPSKDSKPHSIYVEKSTGKVMVASAPMNLKKAVQLIREKDADQGEVAEGHETKANEYTTTLERLEPHTSAGNRPSGAKGEVDTLTTNLRAEIRAIAQILGETIFAGETLDDVPATVITPETENKADTILAEYVTEKTPKGTQPPVGDASQVPGWYFLHHAPTKLTSVGARWVQVHLISEHFGGKGVASNLTPGTNNTNMNALAGIEKPVKVVLAADSPDNGKAVLWYRTKVSYHTQAPAKNTFFMHWRDPSTPDRKDNSGSEVKASMFPSNIKFEWGIYKRTKKAGKTEFKRLPTAIGSFPVGPLDLPSLNT